ncbi:MAG: retropepsin-like aspartic protease [Phycisphaerales bacterium]
MKLVRLAPLALSLLTLDLLVGKAVAGDDPLPVVRAGSPRVDIQDGNRLLRGAWSASPEVERDVYYARRSKGERTITFRTDVDSISFQVQPGQTHDFVILLQDKHRCLTRISTMRESCRMEGASGALAEDAIPFTIGGDHKIHITGRINDSEPLDLLLDMGADTLVLFPSAKDKNPNVRIDGRVDNAGTGGTTTRDTSNDNRVAIGRLRWDHESVLLIERQADQSDGIVGHNLFDDKVVEFDYDAMLVRIHDSVPKSAATWTMLPIQFQGTLPAVQAQFEGGPEAFKEWLVLDTGSSASVYLNRATAVQQQLPGPMKSLGTSRMRGVGEGTTRNEVLLLPRLRVGSLELRDLPIHVRTNGLDSDDGLSGHLGMDVLKRFNTVLDFQNDVAYFTPSALNGAAYRLDYDDGRNWWFVAAGALLVSVITMLWLRWRAIARSVRG